MHIQDWQAEKIGKLDLHFGCLEKRLQAIILFWKTDLLIWTDMLPAYLRKVSQTARTGRDFKVMVIKISKLWNCILPWTKEYQEMLDKDKNISNMDTSQFYWQMSLENKRYQQKNSQGHYLKQYQLEISHQLPSNPCPNIFDPI